MTRSVSLSGDVFDPSGTLTGGTWVQGDLSGDTLGTEGSVLISEVS